MSRKSDPRLNESGSAFLLMLMLTLGLAALVTVLWQLRQTDWQIIASHEERWQGRYLAETGIEKGFEQLASDPSWKGSLEGVFPPGATHRYHVSVSNENGIVIIRSYGVLASGYQSEIIESHITLQEEWPWEI